MNVGSLMDKCKSIQLGNHKSKVKEADDKTISVASPALLIAKWDTKQTKQSRNWYTMPTGMSHGTH